MGAVATFAFDGVGHKFSLGEFPRPMQYRSGICATGIYRNLSWEPRSISSFYFSIDKMEH